MSAGVSDQRMKGQGNQVSNGPKEQLVTDGSNIGSGGGPSDEFESWRSQHQAASGTHSSYGSTVPISSGTDLYNMNTAGYYGSGGTYPYQAYGVSDGTWSNGSDMSYVGYPHDSYGMDGNAMFPPSTTFSAPTAFGQHSSFNYFHGNSDYNTWSNQLGQQPGVTQQRKYDDYYRDTQPSIYAQQTLPDSLKSVEQSMQNLDLKQIDGKDLLASGGLGLVGGNAGNMVSGQMGMMGGGTTSSNNMGSMSSVVVGSAGCGPVLSTPSGGLSAMKKPATWASIASQPAKPQLATPAHALKKKGPGMPPGPIVPGKHNIDFGTWSSSISGGGVANVVSAPSAPSPLSAASATANMNMKPAPPHQQQHAQQHQHPALPPPQHQQQQQQQQQQHHHHQQMLSVVDNVGGGGMLQQATMPVHTMQQQHQSAPPPMMTPTTLTTSQAMQQMSLMGGPNGQHCKGVGSLPVRPCWTTAPPAASRVSPLQGPRPGPPQMSMQTFNQDPNFMPASMVSSTPQQLTSNAQLSAVPTTPPAIMHPLLDKLKDKNNYNPPEFDLTAPNTRFFVIKSYSEDDIHRSIKYEIWCSTEHGNKRLDTAYRERESISVSNNGMPGAVYLFFSVNGSGHFCGMAQMISSVDYNSNSSVWSQDKWKGQFGVRWVYVKDVPNVQFRHIRLENNENKPVTNSRDTQEVPHPKGLQVLRIMHSYRHNTSIFDDFIHYEKRQEEEDSRKQPIPPSHHSTHHRDRGGMDRGDRGMRRDRDRDYDGDRDHINRDQMSRNRSRDRERANHRNNKHSESRDRDQQHRDHMREGNSQGLNRNMSSMSAGGGYRSQPAPQQQQQQHHHNDQAGDRGDRNDRNHHMKDRTDNNNRGRNHRIGNNNRN